MTDKQLLKTGYDYLKQANVFKSWVKGSPKEYAKLDQFVADILAATSQGPAPPAMNDNFGRGLVNWASMALTVITPPIPSTKTIGDGTLGQGTMGGN